MKITIIRTTKDGTGTTVQNVEFNELISKYIKREKDDIISKYREAFPYLDKPESYQGYSRIARLCPISEYYRNKAREHVFRAYNGVSVVKIPHLATSLEVEKVKNAVRMLPQTLCTFVGADNHSVIVWTLATLPDSTLPKSEEAALLFATQAYTTSVQCIQPLIDEQVEIEAPALNTTCLMSIDENVYVNPHPTPFIIEQPTEISLRKLSGEKGKVVKPLGKLMPGAESYFTYSKIFNATYHNVLASIRWKREGDPEEVITQVADHCADMDMPQEEVVIRLSHHFYKMDIDDIRSLVRSQYETNEGTTSYFPMSKHQYVAFRLRDFIKRRYDIRYNEVLQMTEFRERHSFRFMYRELGRRELNTIHHEALLEGIEPTFGEVDELIHSELIETYNPIEDYLDHLPKWDGKDRMGSLAKMVPTDNENWERLFRQWFLSMVAHWMNGDELHANSTSPILIGPQGYRKSTFCRLVLPPELRQFYTDSIDFRSNIEAERCLGRFLLVNIDEFDQLTEKQFAFVKHLFQKPATNIRRMYSETIGTQRRYASFIGTTNSEEVLRDPTGNRRYLCVYVNDVIRTETPIEYAQLYAQAISEITHGTRYWLNDEDEALIKEANKRFEVQSPLEQLFLSVFQRAEEESSTTIWLRPTEIMETLQALKSFNRKKDNDLRQLGRVLTKLQLVKRRSAVGTQYLVTRV